MKNREKNDREKLQDNRRRTTIFSVVDLNYANDFLFICKTELLSRLRK